MDDLIFRMYGSDPYYKEEELKHNQVDSSKKLSKIIGGMKAQGVDCRIVNIDGQDVELPRMDYIRVLEQQVKELRNKNNSLELKVQRLVNQNNTITNKIKTLEDDNKRNPFKFRK